MVSIAGVLLVSGIVPSSVSASPLYTSARGCIDDGEVTRFRPLHKRPPQSIEVWATRGTRDAARRHDAAALKAFTRFKAIFGDTPRSDKPFRLYVVSRADLVWPGNIGVRSEYCSRPAVTAVLAVAGASSSVAAHEIFHAFHNIYTRGQPNNWWFEATATYEEEPDPRSTTWMDRAFFLSPMDAPLDAWQPSGPNDRAYGAFRFVEWLHRHMTPDQYRDFLIETFRSIGSGETATQAVQRALPHAGLRDLGTALGRFWADTLEPTYSHWPVRSDYEGWKIGLNQEGLGLAPTRLGVAMYRVDLTNDVREFHLRARVTSSDGHLWVLMGGTLQELRDGDELSFCVGGPDVADSRPWPGSLVLAFTNGSTSGPADADLYASTSPDPCAAIGPSLERGRCNAPLHWKAPAGFTERIVWSQRWKRIRSEWYLWLNTLGMGEGQGPGAGPKVLRSQAVATECALKRLRGLTHTPVKVRAVSARFAEDLESIAATYHVLADLCENDPELDPFYGDCPSVMHRQSATTEARRTLAFRRVRRVDERAFRDGYYRDPQLAREKIRCDRLRVRMRPRWPRCAGPPEQDWWIEPPFREEAGPEQPA